MLQYIMEVKMRNDFWKEIMRGALVGEVYLSGSERRNLQNSTDEPINLPAMNLDTRHRTNNKVFGNKVLYWGGDFDFKS